MADKMAGTRMDKRTLAKQGKSRKIVFVTGTDTGVGKTLLTGLLLVHLRSSGVRALAMKPFCCGGRGDAKLLDELQDGELTRNLLNPYYFRNPIAPVIAARKSGFGDGPRLLDVVRAIKRVSRLCDVLLVEGAGGIMSPLGKNYDILDLARKLGGNVLVAARNKLGVLSQVRVVEKVIQLSLIKEFVFTLMGVKKPDLSVDSNGEFLAECLGPDRVFEVPFLGPTVGSSARKLRLESRKVKKTIALISDAVILSPFFGTAREKD
jgi:dethiobiotin synthetase